MRDGDINPGRWIEVPVAFPLCLTVVQTIFFLTLRHSVCEPKSIAVTQLMQYNISK